MQGRAEAPCGVEAMAGAYLRCGAGQELNVGLEMQVALTGSVSAGSMGQRATVWDLLPGRDARPSVTTGTASAGKASSGGTRVLSGTKSPASATFTAGAPPDTGLRVAPLLHSAARAI